MPRRKKSADEAPASSTSLQSLARPTKATAGDE